MAMHRALLRSARAVASAIGAPFPAAKDHPMRQALKAMLLLVRQGVPQGLGGVRQFFVGQALGGVRLCATLQTFNRVHGATRAAVLVHELHHCFGLVTGRRLHGLPKLFLIRRKTKPCVNTRQSGVKKGCPVFRRRGSTMPIGFMPLMTLPLLSDAVGGHRAESARDCKRR